MASRHASRQATCTEPCICSRLAVGRSSGPGSSFARLQRLRILFLALVSVMTAGLLTVVLLEGSLTLTVTASDVTRSLEVVHAQLGQQHSAIQH